jgi:hypothetical protein
MGKEKQEELLTLKSKYQVQSVTTGWRMDWRMDCKSQEWIDPVIPEL